MKQSMVPVLLTMLVLGGIGAALTMGRSGLGPIMLELHRFGLVPEQRVADAVGLEQAVKDRLTKLIERRKGGS